MPRKIKNEVMIKNIPSNKIANLYEELPKHLIKKSHNPNFKYHHINIPFRMIIDGGSRSGKTAVVVELIKRRMAGTFEKIVICCKDLTADPLYIQLSEEYEANKKDLPDDALEIYEGAENIPDISKYKDTGQIVIIFDDLVLENKKIQAKIEQYYIRGRKTGNLSSGSISCIYLTQSWFLVPKVIRLNCNYIILKKLNEINDLSLILRQYGMGNKENLIQMYEYATRNPYDFFMIDLDAPILKKYRKNYLEIL